MILYYLILLFSAVPNHPWFGDQVGGVTIIKYVGLLCFIYAIFHLVARGRVPSFFQSWPARFFVALSILAFLSYITKNDVQVSSRGPFIMYVSYLALLFITIVVVDSFNRLRYSLLALIGALTLASLYSLREFQTSGFAAGYRPGYVVGDANFFSAAALIAIPLAYYLMRLKRPRWERLYCLGCLVVTILAFIISSSRGAFVGLCFCVLYMLVRSKRRAGLVILILLLIPLLLYAPSSPLKRIVSPGYGDKASTASHLLLWETGLGLVKAHPIFGIGLGNFWPTIKEMNIFTNDIGAQAHNTYLELAAELGIFGLLLYLAILISAFRILSKVRKRAAAVGDAFSHAAATGMQAGILGFSAAVFFFSGEYEKPLWIVVFLSICMPHLIRPGQQTAKTVETPELLITSDAEELLPVEGHLAE